MNGMLGRRPGVNKGEKGRRQMNGAHDDGDDEEEEGEGEERTAREKRGSRSERIVVVVKRSGGREDEEERRARRRMLAVSVVDHSERGGERETDGLSSNLALVNRLPYAV